MTATEITVVNFDGYRFTVGPIHTYHRVMHNGQAHLVEPGWYRRDTDLTKLTGWRLLTHRILWGYDRLVDAR